MITWKINWSKTHIWSTSIGSNRIKMSFWKYWVTWSLILKRNSVGSKVSRHAYATRDYLLGWRNIDAFSKNCRNFQKNQKYSVDWIKVKNSFQITLLFESNWSGVQNVNFRTKKIWEKTVKNDKPKIDASFEHYWNESILGHPLYWVY